MQNYKLIRYITNCLCIAYALFILLFSLDLIKEGIGLDADLMMKFFIHSIPSILIFLIMMITLKKDFKRALLLIILNILFFFFFRMYNNTELLYVITLPLIIIAGLYISVFFLKLEHKKGY